MSEQPFDFGKRAFQEMLNAGFQPVFEPEVLKQVAEIENGGVLPETTDGEIRDLRTLLWSSIDNRESKDLDQIEWAERLPSGNIRLLIGIADVDAVVPELTPIDVHASANAMTVYTGQAIFPMLPEELSTDRTSLALDQDRLCMVSELEIDSTGKTANCRFYRAQTRNFAKLAYEEVGEWLESTAQIPGGVKRIEGMEAQIRLQAEAGELIRKRRVEEGALEFETIEASPVVEDGKVVRLEVTRKNPARLLIENFMIAANSAIAGFLEANSIPSIQRVVRSPRRWDRIMEIAAKFGVTLPITPDPKPLSLFLESRKQADRESFAELSLSIVKLMGPGEYVVVRSQNDHAGHFGLAAYSYTHSTAPNRRYADVVVQRCLKAALAKLPAPYAPEKLVEMATHCTERENAARKVERTMRKVTSALWMREKIGEKFEAIVTGKANKGTFVRLTHPPVEGSRPPAGPMSLCARHHPSDDRPTEKEGQPWSPTADRGRSSSGSTDPPPRRSPWTGPPPGPR